jgi:hypothetical protein
MKTIYDFTALTEVAPKGMVSVAEALGMAGVTRVLASAEEEILKVADGAVCGMPLQKAEVTGQMTEGF